MLRRTLFLFLVLFFSTVQAQTDTLPVRIFAGFGGGLPFFQTVEKQDFAVESITGMRDHSTQLQFGVQFNRKSKNKLEVFFKRTRFSSDEEGLETEFQNRFPDTHYYPQYTVAFQGSRPYFNMNSLNFQYGRELSNSKITVLPYVGIGAGFWWQKDFRFILRDKNSNFGTEYNVSLKKNIRPTYTLGTRFGINRFPMIHLDLSIHGGQNEYTYYINGLSQGPNQSYSNYEVRFKRMVNSVNLVLIFQLV